MNIGILFGGKSFEHDISIITANTIYQILKDKYNIHLLYINQDGNFKHLKKMDIEKFISRKKFRNLSFIFGGIKCGLKKVKLDVIINAMHGINGEDGLGSVISNLYNIPFVGANHISAGTLMDKHFTYAILLENNIKVLETKALIKDEKIDAYSFPVIIKPARLGSSIGIRVSNNLNELNSCLKECFKYDSKVIIQPFIHSFREVNQALYFYNNDFVFSNIEEVFKKDEILSFKDKYEDVKVSNEKRFLADDVLINQISIISKKIYTLFELSGVVRIDYMIIDGEIYVNEVNTTPGSLAFYLFDNNYDMFSNLIYEALKNFQNKPKTTFESFVLYQKNFNKK